MTTWRVNNSTALGGEVCSPWQANHAYGLGARCICTRLYATQTARAFVYEVTSAGTSHATTQPTWPTTPGDTVVDNGATWTCRSPSDGNWDNASACLAYVLNHTAIAAGDTVYVDDGTDETIDYGGYDYIVKGSATSSNPIKVICVNKADDTLSTGALCGYNQNVMLFQAYGYSYGVCYRSNNSGIYMCQGVSGWIVEGANSDVLKMVATSTRIWSCNTTTAGVGTFFKIINGNIRVPANTTASGLLYIYGSGVLFDWQGGSLVLDGAGGFATLIYNYDVSTSIFLLRDVDLSAMGNGADARYLFNPQGASYQFAGILRLERCKLPTAAGFALITGVFKDPGYAGRLILHHCTGANATYTFTEYDQKGYITNENTVVRTGGASDGTTQLAYKLVSNAKTIDQLLPLISPPIVSWTDSTTEKTFALEGIYDGVTNLQDDELWLELEYPADNTSGLGARATSRCAILGTPADLASSAETWGGSLGDPNKFTLSVTVTPGKAGPITARVCLAKASTTVYIDPKIVES